MTTIRATCPICGEVDLTPDDIELWICTEKSRSYYCFWCVSCERQIQKMADDRIISLLIQGGVPARSWELPVEMREPHTGPVITPDDELTLHLELDRNEPETHALIDKMRDDYAKSDPAFANKLIEIRKHHDKHSRGK